ncbi:MAG: histidine phosphotransferase family protein [Pseudomonadota bacterium]
MPDASNLETAPINDLTSLIGSRICHDLISPLGAIGNGVELITMSGGAQGPEIGLISESVENANARIRFFRVAFGSASASAELGQAELNSILRDLYKSSRVKVDWRIEGAVSRREVKLAFLLLLCIEDLLPWGGRVTVTRSGDRWMIEARAEKMKVRQELWDMLNDPDYTQVTASDVHFALVASAARSVRRQVASFLGADRATLSF